MMFFRIVVICLVYQNPKNGKFDCMSLSKIPHPFTLLKMGKSCDYPTTPIEMVFGYQNAKGSLGFNLLSRQKFLFQE